eukprot:scaffold63001_cov75-Phaeocystis_antarctica.AAC.1
MTPNHLAWAKVTPIKNKSTILALLERSKHNLTVSIPKHIAVIDDSPLDVSATIERTGKETTAEIDEIAVDPCRSLSGAHRAPRPEHVDGGRLSDKLRASLAIVVFRTFRCTL